VQQQIREVELPPQSHNVYSKWSTMTDAAEKVGGIPLTRNNRIIEVDFLNEVSLSTLILNQCCSESPPRSFFRLHRP
jgi:hypothetical protein